MKRTFEELEATSIAIDDIWSRKKRCGKIYNEKLLIYLSQESEPKTGCVQCFIHGLGQSRLIPEVDCTVHCTVLPTRRVDRKNGTWYLTKKHSHMVHWTGGSLQYVCRVCSKTCTSSNGLTNHLRIHTCERPFQCTYEGCDQAFTQSSHLTNHIRTHTGERPFQCTYEDCDKAFTTSVILTKHIRTHTGERPFQCTYEGCGMAFARNCSLANHVRTHTGEKPYQCTYEGCDQAFTTSGNLITHIRTHTGERPYQCTYEGCNMAFTQSTHLTRHIRTHTGEKPFPCTYEGCGMAFARSTHLIMHIRTHTGERPFQCTYEGCGMAFTRSTYLTRHIRTHTGEKPYLCTYEGCNMAFTIISALTTHMRTHTGEKPYQCDECEKRFAHLSNLRTHQLSHENAKTWTHVCQYAEYSVHLYTPGHGIPCESRFKTQKLLDNHIRRNHTQAGINKYVPNSESRLAEYLDEHGVSYSRDWENRIDFKSCGGLQTTGSSSARPDFHITCAVSWVGSPIVLIVCNDEHQHRRNACEFKRVWLIYHAIKLQPEYATVPVVFIRFNPHRYTTDNIVYDTPIRRRFEALLKYCQEDLPEENLGCKGPHLKFMFYDTTDGFPDVCIAPDIANSDNVRNVLPYLL